MSISYDFVVPDTKEYVKALKAIKKSVNDRQKKMLECHFRSQKWSASFGAMAEAAGIEDWQTAIDEYNELGRMLGEKLNMGYLESVSRPGEPLYCSSIGSGNPYRAEDENYHLVMYREVIEALYKVKWFK